MPLRHLGKNVVIAGALVGAGFLVAWLRFRPHLGNEARWTDGQVEYEVSEAEGGVRYAVWEPPVPLAGEVNGSEGEGRPAVSPDGRTLVFASGGRGLGAELYRADLVDGRARDPRPLDLLNSPADELAPAFGGGYLWFASDRPGGAGGLDLWRAPWIDGVPGPAEWLGAAVNGPTDDTDPGPSADGARVAFASDRPGDDPRARHGFDLYLARLGVGDAWSVGPLASLNGPGEEREPAFASDGRTLFLASDRDGGRGGFDLYRSALGREGWLPPVPLEGVNGAGDERGPAPSADGFTLVYSGSVGDAAPDLWRARTLELFREPGRPVGWRELLLLTVLLMVALLAWLAKRWEKLDVLYKCLLVSLVVHLLAMLWFREVHPERELYAVEPGGTRVRLRLEGPSGDAARNAERAGDVQVARATAAERAARPAKGESEAPEVQGGARAEAARAERLAAATPEAPAAREARLPSEAAAARSTAPARALVDAPEAFERRAGAAPDLTLEGRPEAELARRVAEAGETAPAALAAPAGGTPELVASGAARAPDGARAEAARRASEAAPEARPAAADPRAAARGTEVAADLSGPRVDPASAGDLRGGAAAPLALAGSDAAELERARSEARPEATPGAGLAGVPLTERLDAPAPGGERTPLVPRGGERAPAAGPASAAPERRAPGEALAAGDLRDAPEPRDPGGADGSAGPAPGLELERDALLAAADLERGTPESSAPARGEGPSRPAGGGLDVPLLPAGGAASVAALERSSAAGAPAPTRTPSSAPGRALPSLDDLGGVDLADAADPAPEGPAGPAAGPTAAGPERAGAPAPDLALERVADAGPVRRTGGDGPRPAGAARGATPELPAFDRPGRSDLPALELPGRTPDEALPTRVAARLDRTPYRSRTGPEKTRAIDLHGGSLETEAAVAAGLAYLASIQDPGGFWGSADDHNEKYRHVAVGKSGLCLLAFLGAGHWPGSGTEHEAVATRAVDFLLAVQHEGTGHFGDTNAYSHAIATYALGEYHALTGDARVRPALERGVAWILEHQDGREDPRLFGGWGYYYPDGLPADRWPRVSVTVWQVMALESARLGGVAVPDRAFDDARTFLRRSWDEARGAFRYSHDPGRLRGEYAVLPGSTPAALFGLSLLGDDVAGREHRGARRFVQERRPDGFRWQGTDAFVQRAAGNLYFWYYGTLATFRIGGRDWDRWNEAMKATLLPAQAPDGSWEPISVYATDYAGDDRRDRSYTTALCVLSLEVYYRYFTPLLKVE